MDLTIPLCISPLILSTAELLTARNLDNFINNGAIICQQGD